MNKLKRITSEAKKLYKTGKYKKWTDAIKAASKKIGATGTHKDTKSHNVNIRVVSGTVSSKDFTRISNDINGNPRYVIHYLNIAETYPKAVAIANKLGGKKYHNKQYGGGVVFQSYNIDDTARRLNEQISKKVGAVKIIQKGESKNARVTKVLQQVRNKKGTFKGYKQISGIENVSAGAKKLWLDINKKGLFKYNTEENILQYLYDEAIRKGQFKKAEYLKELLNDVKFY